MSQMHFLKDPTTKQNLFLFPERFNFFFCNSLILGLRRIETFAFSPVPTLCVRLISPEFSQLSKLIAVAFAIGTA